MYKNLVAEMAKERITQKQIADTIGIHPNSVFNKLDGKTPFTIEQAFAIKKAFFPEQSLNYLFESQ